MKCFSDLSSAIVSKHISMVFPFAQLYIDTKLGNISNSAFLLLFVAVLITRETASLAGILFSSIAPSHLNLLVMIT